ncbi:MAG: hypothetical protein Q8P22_02385 [Chloroflexota bacterium]|nr:hypothetical protein [Chloroflexota bacterium]
MAAKETSFRFFLDPENQILLRANFTTERGEVLRFTVQLELHVGEEVKPLVRVDNAHGFVHQHTFYPDGRVEERRLRFASDSEAYGYAYQMLKSRWRELRERYERASMG